MKRSSGAESAPVEPGLEGIPPGKRPLELVPAPEPDELGGGESETTRRTMVMRALLAAAGVVGIGYAGAKLGDDGPAKAVAPLDGEQELTLFVRDVRFSSDMAHGTITGAGGGELGELTAGLLPESSGELEVQRFALTDGMLIGMGPGGLDNVEYAIVGGTGRFSGASGSYRVRLSPGSRGQDAEFQFTVKGVNDGS